MTHRDLELIKQRFPVSESVARRSLDAGDTGLRATDKKQAQGKSLERIVSGEEASRYRTTVSPKPRRRSRIRFVVYAVRPADWDGWHVKELQDLLVKAGCLDGDDWDILQGEVISEKVHSKVEEKTVVTITPCH
jgi:hypothetical protein